MKIGLIDVDGHNFPNIPLMKLSAWHKKKGDSVEWYEHVSSGKMDVVYMSKVFSFTDDYPYPINADKIVKSGSGYAVSLVDGKEVYDKSADVNLPYEIEHIYPDYSLYPGLTKDTAYGFLTRGCPRGYSVFDYLYGPNKRIERRKIFDRVVLTTKWHNSFTMENLIRS